MWVCTKCGSNSRSRLLNIVLRTSPLIIVCFHIRWTLDPYSVKCGQNCAQSPFHRVSSINCLRSAFYFNWFSFFLLFYISHHALMINMPGRDSFTCPSFLLWQPVWALKATYSSHPLYHNRYSQKSQWKRKTRKEERQIFYARKVNKKSKKPNLKKKQTNKKQSIK